MSPVWAAQYIVITKICTILYRSVEVILKTVVSHTDFIADANS